MLFQCSLYIHILLYAAEGTEEDIEANFALLKKLVRAEMFELDEKLKA